MKKVLRSSKYIKDDRKIYNIGWVKYIKDIYELANTLQYVFNSKDDFAGIFGIPRGGVIPATIISHELEIPWLAEMPEGKLDRKILIVEDIVDTGSTLNTFHEWNRGGNDCIYSSIYCCEDNKLDIGEKNLLFFNELITKDIDWIKLPYELEDVD